jgi:FkbM family methyltransferase
MIVNTRRLFAKLLPRLQIGVVCDVGSMDGEDALLFRAVAPAASIYAFEPNPDNFRLMAGTPQLSGRGIQLVPLAVTNYDGEAEFFLVRADYSQATDARRGMSSLYRRGAEWAPEAVVPVTTTRLDSFLARRSPEIPRVAVWIDAEGKGYEVVDGLTGIAGQVQLLHVEVETAACIGASQRLYPEVKELLLRLGFLELATDRFGSRPQFNALFVRSDLPFAGRMKVRMSLVQARMRYVIGGLLRGVCPGCLQRYRAMRRKTLP